MSRESTFAAEFSRALRECAAMVYPIVASAYAPRGWPDKLVVHRRWWGLVELKSDQTRVRPEQLVVHQQLWARRPGGNFVVRRSGSDQVCTVELWNGEVLVRDVRVGIELLDELGRLECNAT